MERDDIFDENGALSRGFLLARGYCCGNGCRNCPYEPRHGGLSATVPNEASEPQAVGPHGKPVREQLANLDVKSELQSGQEDEK